VNPRLLRRIPKRTYARVTPRRTTVAEDVEVTRETAMQQQQKRQQQQAYEQPPEEGDQDTTESAITPDVAAHLNKVYGTIMGGMGACAVGAAAGTVMPALALPAMVCSFIGIISLMLTNPEKITLRTSLFIGTTGLLGLSIGPLVAASTLGTVFAAALGTTGIFAGFSMIALKARRKAMLAFGGPLLGLLMCLVFCSLGGMVLPLLGVTNPALLGALYNINLYGGLALFSFFISYDTQRMIEEYKAGNRDHISPALSMFLNLFNIFVRLLAIFRGD